MSKLTFYKPPDIQKGYIFNPQKSFFSVIIPEETTNLIYNPETQHLEDISVVGDYASVMLDTEEVLFGTSSAIVVLPQDDYLIYDLITSLVPDTIYTFSVYLKGYGQIRMGIYNETGDVLHAVGKSIDLNPEIWTRHIFKFTTPSEGLMEASHIRIYGLGAFSNFWMTGLQLEQKPYATTFCSGNLSGLIVGEFPKPYFWTSTPNFSPSIRLATTRDGGKVVSLETLGFHVTGFNGFGLPEFDIVSTPVASGVGSVYQGSVIETRDIEICGVLMSRSVSDFFMNRGMLSHTMQPNISGTAQPVKLLYSVYECDKQICQQVEILAMYQSGLEGEIGSLLGEEICISLTMTDPFFKALGNKARTLNVFQQVLDEHGPVGTDINGEWRTMTNNIEDLFGGNAGGDMTIGPDNNLYIGGVSNPLGGGDGTAIARWNGIGWDSVGKLYNSDKVTLASGHDITTIIPGPNGSLYVGGNFNAIGNENGVISVTDGDGTNVADTFARLNIARYDITTNTWHYIGRFLGESGKLNIVMDMIMLKDGIIDTATLNGKIMIVGNFRNPESTNDTVFTGSRNIITYNPTTNLFETSVPMGENELGLTDDSIIYAIEQAPNGEIWVGGDFTFLGSSDGAEQDDIDGHLVIENIAVWGRFYENDCNCLLGFEGASGSLNWSNLIGGPVYVIKAAQDGTVYVGGAFEGTQIWSEISTSYYPPHVQVSDTPELHSSAAFGFAQIEPGFNPDGWFSPLILGSMGWTSGDEFRLGTVNDIAIDQNGHVHIVGTFNFANTYFPNKDYEALTEEADVDWSVAQALSTQTPNVNGYVIWDGSNIVYPDILFSNEEGIGDEPGDPRNIGLIELGSLYNNRYAEHSSAPIPGQFDYHMPGSGGSNVNPGFSGSVFLVPSDDYDYIAKDIIFIDLECNDYSKPVFVINGPGILKSIINETTGDAIYFDYPMLVGESLVLDLTQPLFKLTSNIKGNLRGIINPNSSISSFVLNSGIVGISVNIDLTTVDEDTPYSYIKWRTQYWSVDKACAGDCSDLGTYNDD